MNLSLPPHTPGDPELVISLEDIDLDIFDDPPAFEPEAAEPQCIDTEAVEVTGSEGQESDQKQAVNPKPKKTYPSPGKPGDPWPRKERDGPMPKEAGYDPPAFARQRERAKEAAKLRLMSFMSHVGKGKSIKAAAEAIGVHPHYAKTVMWPKVKALALTDWASPEEKEALTELVMGTYVETLVEAKEKVREHAAYGAVIVGIGKELREIIGIDFTAGKDGESKSEDLEALGEQIREAMPALMGHHDHLARIKQRQLERRGVAVEAAEE